MTSNILIALLLVFSNSNSITNAHLNRGSSEALTHRQQKGLHQRLDEAEPALSKLAAKPHQDHCALQTKVQFILKRYRVTDYFLTEIKTETVTR